MSAVNIHAADLTDSADAFRLGYPDAVGSTVAERTDPGMARRRQATMPPVFPRDPVGAGFKLVLDRLFRFGGNMGVPSGPGRYTGRMRASRGSGAPGPETMNRAPSMPAGLVKTDPTYESYLTGSDGYLG